MPRRHPQPFWREFMHCWYVQIGKKQIKLHPDRDEAFRRYYELMAMPPEPERAAVPTGPDLQVVEILDAFLDWAQKHKAPRTYNWYRDFYRHLASTLPPALKVTELKPFHLTQAMDAKPDWSNNTRNDFVTAVKRAFNWGLDEEMIERNPVARAKKPAREARDTVVTPEEYAVILDAIREPRFRDLVEFNWETGARPQESRKIEARFYDGSRIVFPPKEAKGKKYHRIIYLTPRAKEIVDQLVKEHPTGPLLVNSEGAAWNKNSINCAIRRLRVALGLRLMEPEDVEKVPRFRKWDVPKERLADARREHRERLAERRKAMRKKAIELSKQYHLGALRKGFATEALKNGVDTVTLGHILGHRDPSMVSRVYGQVQHDPEHMANAVKKARRVKDA